MAEDKIIKSGQFTLRRILFLVVVGGIIAATVALGGVWLSVGYWILTLGLCGLLFVIMKGYGVRMEGIELSRQGEESVQSAIAAPVSEVRTTMAAQNRETRPARRKGKRPAKRRR